MHASRVRPGSIAATSTAVRSIGSTTRSGSAGGEQGHRRPAPGAGAIVEDAHRPAARRPVTRLRSQGPETNARFPAIIASPNSVRPERQVDPEVQASRPRSTSGRSGPIQIKTG